METKIATNIETELFYSIIKFLTENDWKITIEYSTKIFDKGIDFDLYQLKNNDDTIISAWTNWFEGELKASIAIIENIEKHFGIAFRFGDPEHLGNQNLIEEMKELLDFKE
jgi:hypothetical protein